MCYRDGIHRCWYDMMIIRDMYRDWAKHSKLPMHADVLTRFIDTIVVMMSPICPHWSEHLWGLIGGAGSVSDAAWPSFTPCDRLVRKQLSFYKNFLKDLRQEAFNPKAKVKGKKSVAVYLAATYEPKSVLMLRFLQDLYAESGGSFPEDLKGRMQAWLASQPELKKDTGLLMQFGVFMANEAKERGVDALAVEQPFDQMELLQVCTHGDTLSQYTSFLLFTFVFFVVLVWLANGVLTWFILMIRRMLNTSCDQSSSKILNSTMLRMKECRGTKRSSPLPSLASLFLSSPRHEAKRWQH